MAKVTIKQRGESGLVPEEPSVKPPVVNDGITRLPPDARGRVLGVKNPNPLERVRLFEILGPESAQNVAVLLEVMPAYNVVEIDGEKLRRPVSRRELDARMLEIGDEGQVVIQQWMVEQVEIAKSDAEQKDILKNSSGMPVSEE